MHSRLSIVTLTPDSLGRSSEVMLRATEAWHSPVTEGELAATCGLLDPAHSQTPKIIEQVVAVIERRPSYRTMGLLGCVGKVFFPQISHKVPVRRNR